MYIRMYIVHTLIVQYVVHVPKYICTFPSTVYIYRATIRSIALKLFAFFAWIRKLRLLYALV